MSHVITPKINSISLTSILSSLWAGVLKSNDQFINLDEPYYCVLSLLLLIL